MGADMILYAVYVDDITRHDQLDIREKKMYKAVKKLSEKEMNQFIKDTKNSGSYEINEIEKDDDKKIKECSKEYYDLVKEEIDGRIEVFMNTIDSNDVTSIGNDIGSYYITGGLSYGDEPTDACSVFGRFLELPYSVLKAGGFENYGPNIFDLFMHKYSKKMPKDMKDKLNKLFFAESL